MFKRNGADVWVRTADLWCRKRPHYQLRHYHGPPAALAVYEILKFLSRESNCLRRNLLRRVSCSCTFRKTWTTWGTGSLSPFLLARYRPRGQIKSYLSSSPRTRTPLSPTSPSRISSETAQRSTWPRPTRPAIQDLPGTKQAAGATSFWTRSSTSGELPKLAPSTEPIWFSSWRTRKCKDWLRLWNQVRDKI